MRALTTKWLCQVHLKAMTKAMGMMAGATMRAMTKATEMMEVAVMMTKVTEMMEVAVMMTKVTEMMGVAAMMIAMTRHRDRLHLARSTRHRLNEKPLEDRRSLRRHHPLELFKFPLLLHRLPMSYWKVHMARRHRLRRAQSRFLLLLADLPLS